MTKTLKDYIKIIENIETSTEVVSEDAGTVEIIGYNSGWGNTLDKAAKDPKNRRKVKVEKLGFGMNGQPELKFRELDGDGPFTAEWDPQYGWHADFS